MDTFCLMRFPGEDRIFCCGFRPAVDIDRSKYFLIKPFNRDSSPIQIPCTLVLDDYHHLTENDFQIMMDIAIKDAKSDKGLPFDTSIASPERHEDIVADCIKYLSESATDGLERKIVLSRSVLIQKEPDEIRLLLIRLLHERKDATVFFLSTPQTGTWLGVTPELLLEYRDNTLYSMALAGTRPVDSGGIEWDQKNIIEQRIVTAEIVNTLQSFGLQPDVSEPMTRQAGNVEHICSYITGNNTTLPDTDIISIATELSPTPALCGYPRAEAFDYISTHEVGARELYGGFIGLIDTHAHNTRLYVCLRSARYNPVTQTLKAFAGGGITPLSDPHEEVLETERKLKWMS